MEGDPTPRCVRGDQCEDRTTILDPDGLVPRIVVGAQLVNLDAQLCPTCTRYLRYALQGFPLDVVELEQRYQPSMQVRLRPADMPAQPRVKLHSPAPLNLHAYALVELVAGELNEWSISTAAAAGVPWSRELAARSSVEHRVRNACLLLINQLDWFLGLPDVEHPVRSSGADQLDGWSAESVARMTWREDCWWIARNGTEGALLVFELRRQLEQFLGKSPADRVFIRCPNPECGRRGMVREHRACRVVCRLCWHSITDDQYEKHRDRELLQLGARR